ncbi:MAG: response regulator [Desulfobulbaceae bacterium]|nr:response regulator [Desulfobulbaceae bacterium]
MEGLTKILFNFKKGIGHRLLLYIIIFSSVITCLGTAFQLYIEYSRDMLALTRSIKQIETSSVPTLINTLWVSDYDLLKDQMGDILRIPDIEYLTVQLDNELVAELGTPQYDNIILRKFPMTYSYNNKKINLGTLSVTATLTGVRERLFDRIFIIVGTQAVKTFLVSMFILLLFHYLVGRHLIRIANYTRSFNFKDKPIAFTINRSPSKKGKEDELDQLVFSINQMRENLMCSLNELCESEEQLSLALKAAGSGMWDFHPQTGKTYFSQECFTLLGYRPDECRHDYETWRNLVHPVDGKIVEGEIKDHLKEGLDLAFEFRMKSQKGEWKWVLLKGQCVQLTQDGSPERILGILMDITQRKNAEKALQESEDRLGMILNSLGTAIVVVNAKKKIVEANPAAVQMMDVPKEDLLGANFDEFISVSSEGRGIQIDELGQNQENVEFSISSRKGYIIPVLKTTRPITLGGEQCSLECFVDISEKKRLESKLQQAQKLEAIGTLAGGIAHDFNNLLTGMLGNISLIFLDIDPSHPHYERLKRVEKLILSAAQLTSQLLGYARKGRYEVKPINLNQLVEETSGTFGRTRKEITIHRELAEDLLAVSADSGQIEQVLLNLFINAADAMPDGGELFLKTANMTHREGEALGLEPGEYVLLTVKDTGMGMDKDTMERIFEPFFTTKEMGRGTGLGLASVYGIIKGHGGYIDVDSQTERGTTFSIYLPVSKIPVGKAVEIAGELSTGTEMVLLVDDEEIVLDVARKLLETLNYRVLTAKDGDSAIEIFRDKRDDIDLVLLDMVMPHMSGGKVYDQLRGIKPDVKVLLSSGYSITGQATEILERGCNGFIQKPFRVEDLSRKVREILDK